MVELVVSLVVMSLIVLLIGSSLNIFSGSWSQHLGALERQDSLLRGAQVFRRDIRSIRPIPVVESGRKIVLFEGTARVLRFLSFAPGHISGRGLHVVEYKVHRDDDGYKLVRRFADWRHTSRLGETTVRKPVVVVGDLADGQFLYGNNSGRRTVWLEQWSNAGGLPALVSFAGRSRKDGTKHVISARVRADTEQVCVLGKDPLCTFALENARKPDQSGELRQ